MKCPAPECGAETDGSKAKYCCECGTALIQYAESIICNGKDDDGDKCKENIKKGKKFCYNCGRKVDPKEFLLGNCRKCGEYCPASNKMCNQCLHAETLETNARVQLEKLITERIQRPTESCPSLPSCERCGMRQSSHWTYCLHCGEKHRPQPREQRAINTEDQFPVRPNDGVMEFREEHYRGDTEDSEETQSQRETLYFGEEFTKEMNYDMGSDEVDDDILITTAEADVIQTILDNDQSRKTNTPAIKTVSDPSPQISAKAASVQNSLAKQNSTKEKVAAIQKILGLHRHTKLDVAVSQTVSDQGKFGTIQKRAGQENPAAFQRETDHANVAAAQKPAGPTNAAAFQNVPDQEKLAAIQKLAGLANAEEFQKILDPEEADTFHKVLDQCGYSELMEILENSHNAWRDSTIKIAITGESGSGKSSFINALCGRKDDEPGAAHTDCIEGTMEPTPYPHPSNENLVLWDLPGVGTPNFPKETYIEDACFDEYDFIILVSCTRYTNNDTWLAEQITSHFPGANLIFVRTKVDNDLQSKRKGRKVPMSEDEIKKVFNIIKQDCYDKLKKAKIENPRVFLVDNHDQSNFEFSNLADMLVDKVSILKKEALVMTIASFSPNIVTAKYEMSKKRLTNISKQAAVAAVKSNRENGERLEMNILIEEVLLYKQQFGIDTTSLDIVAQRFGIDLEEVYIKMDSETHVILRRFEQYYIDHDKVTTQYDSFPWYRKILINKLRMYQTQCYSVLKTLLQKCVKENKTLQKNIAVWSLIPK